MKTFLYSVVVIVFIFVGSVIFQAGGLSMIQSKLKTLQSGEYQLVNPFSQVDYSLDSEEIVRETNQQRIVLGLTPLSSNPVLAEVSKNKVRDMFEHNYFEHISPEGTSVGEIAEQFDYHYAVIGENLALGNYAGAKDIVKAWMESPGHKENIVSPHYTEIGVYAEEGVYRGQNVWIAVQTFARPLSDCPEIDQALERLIATNKNRISQIEKGIKEKQAEIENVEPGEERRALVQEYNAVVKELNTLAKETKNLIATYNAQVSAFNQCATGQ